jgi:ubiquinone/menaquinone biosynthesis C-methylase UbiE
MDKPMSAPGFRLMSLIFKVRDLLRPRRDILREAEIGPGFRVLDYGCGPGSYTFLAADLVGPTGSVYALDIHPLAVERVRKAASKRGLENVRTILSDSATGLENGSVDVALMYDVFHDLGDQRGVLQELHRVLRPEGTLSFSDHHMKDADIVSKVTKTGLFKLTRQGEKTHTFVRVG